MFYTYIRGGKFFFLVSFKSRKGCFIFNEETKTMKKQAGFTLVEIAIVMVIIGLLLGGVLKGQEIITNAKIKNLENDFTGVTAAIYSYQDRYRALPGDDVRASERFSAAISIPSGDGDGEINGYFNDKSLTPTVESRYFWTHLRSAGLVAGAGDDNKQPTHAFGGVVGVSTDDVGLSIPGLYVGFSQVPNNIAQVIEARTDDAKPDSGNIQGLLTGGTGGTAPTTYSSPTKQLFDLYFSL